MTGLGITARDARIGTLAPQHRGSDRVAVWQYLIRAEGGVARADELGWFPRRERDPLPVVELTVSGPRRWRPVAVDDVATGPVRVDHAADLARRRVETAQFIHLAVGGRRFGHLVGSGCRLRRPFGR